MPKEKYHPSVAEFKEFVRRHPQVIKQVRQGSSTWQELYEEWYLLGEDDPKWGGSHSQSHSSHTENANSSEEKNAGSNQAFMNNILNTVKKMDMNQIQYYIEQLSGALATAQQLLSQYQATDQGNRKEEHRENRPNPFLFRKD